MARRGNQKGAAGVVSKATPATPATVGRSEHYIDLRGKSQAEIVAINLSIGDARAIPDLLMLCIPRPDVQNTTSPDDGQLTKQPISESA